MTPCGHQDTAVSVLLCPTVCRSMQPNMQSLPAPAQGNCRVDMNLYYLYLCCAHPRTARTGWTSNLTDATAELAGHICKGQLHATVGPRQLQPSCLGSNPPLMVAKLDCTQPQLKLAQLHTLYSFFALKHKLRPCSRCPRTREQTEDRYQPTSNVQPDAPTACAATTAAGHSNKHCDHTALLLQPPLTSQNTGRGHPHSCTPKPPLLGGTLGTPTAAHMKLSLLLLLHPLPGCDCHCRTA